MLAWSASRAEYTHFAVLFLFTYAFLLRLPSEALPARVGADGLQLCDGTLALVLKRRCGRPPPLPCPPLSRLPPHPPLPFAHLAWGTHWQPCQEEPAAGKSARSHMLVQGVRGTRAFGACHGDAAGYRLVWQATCPVHVLGRLAVAAGPGGRLFDGTAPFILV